jgi:hypothetical protein
MSTDFQHFTQHAEFSQSKRWEATIVTALNLVDKPRPLEFHGSAVECKPTTAVPVPLVESRLPSC